MTERADQLHHDNAPVHSTAIVKASWQSIISPRSVSLPYIPDLAPCDLRLFSKLKSALEVRKFVNATVTQYTSSVNGVSLPTDYPHGRVTVHGSTVRSPLTGCQVIISRPRDRFSRYSKWLDTFQRMMMYGWVGSLTLTCDYNAQLYVATYRTFARRATKLKPFVFVLMNPLCTQDGAMRHFSSPVLAPLYKKL
jgi:hypothetical protein